MMRYAKAESAQQQPHYPHYTRYTVCTAYTHYMLELGNGGMLNLGVAASMHSGRTFACEQLLCKPNMVQLCPV